MTDNLTINIFNFAVVLLLNGFINCIVDILVLVEAGKDRLMLKGAEKGVNFNL